MVNVFYSFWKNRFFKLKTFKNKKNIFKNLFNLSYLIIFIPFVSNALDINKARNWRPPNDGTVLMGINAEDKSIWHLVVSDYQIHEDGTLLFFGIGENGQSAYVHLDCRLNYVTFYWDNFNSSQKTNGATVADGTRQYFCFNEHKKGKYISYGGYITQNPFNYRNLGWFPNKTKKNGDEYLLTTMEYRNTNGDFIQYNYDESTVKVNCKINSASDNTGTYQYKKNDKRYDFLIDTACGNNNVLEANGFQYSFHNNSQTSSTGIDKDSIKQTCRDLGFSEGTDKYGECVLQLLEK